MVGTRTEGETVGDPSKLTREEWDAVDELVNFASVFSTAYSNADHAADFVRAMLERRKPEPPPPAIAELMETFLKTFRFDDRQRLWEAIVREGHCRHHLELAGSEVTIRAVANDPNLPPHKHYVIEIS
jgi:hypothetical protein